MLQEKEQEQEQEQKKREKGLEDFPTKQELSQLWELKREIRLLKKQLAYAADQARKCTAGSAFSPGGTGRAGAGAGDRDRVGKWAAETADLQSLLERSLQQCCQEQNRLCRSIQEIPDSQLRQVFRLRYLQGMSWQRIALEMGKADESVLRKKHNRFLERCPKFPDRIC